MYVLTVSSFSVPDRFLNLSRIDLRCSFEYTYAHTHVHLHNHHMIYFSGSRVAVNIPSLIEIEWDMEIEEERDDPTKPSSW